MKKLIIKFGIGKLIGGAVATLGVIAVISATVMLITKNQPSDDAEETVATQTESTESDGDTTGDIAETAAIPGFTLISVTADATDVDAPFYNPSDNEVTLKLTLTLSDGSVLYESQELQPGETVDMMELSQSLAAGDYDATLHYDVYAMNDDHTELNGADIAVTVRAE